MNNNTITVTAEVAFNDQFEMEFTEDELEQLGGDDEDLEDVAYDQGHRKVLDQAIERLESAPAAYTSVVSINHE